MKKHYAINLVIERKKSTDGEGYRHDGYIQYKTLKQKVENVNFFTLRKTFVQGLNDILNKIYLEFEKQEQK